MSANIVSIDSRLWRRSRDWSPQELAEFYRVESALVQAGLNIDTERGLSDEGDPWFAFCRRDDGEVIVHIARIGGSYALAGPAYEGIAYGPDIETLVRDLISRYPVLQVPGNKRGSPSKIFLHPAALLAAVVATAFFKSSEARALDSDHKATDDKVNDGRAAAIRFTTNEAENANPAAMLNAAEHAAAIVAAIVTALQTTSGEQGQDYSQAEGSASDLIDLGALPPAAVHHAAPLHPSLAGGGAKLGTDIVAHFPTHVAATGALPVGTVSVELSADRSVQPPSASHVSESPPAADGAAGTLESSILGADAVLHIQAAKAGSGTKAVTEAHQTGQDNIPKRSDLKPADARDADLQPADLSHALQTATHSAVQSQIVDPAPSGSSASSSTLAVPIPPTQMPTGGGLNTALQSVSVNANQNFIGWIAAVALAGVSDAVTVNITGNYGAAGTAKNIGLGNDTGVPGTAATPMNAYENETISAAGPTFVWLGSATTGALSTTSFVLTGAGALEVSANAKGDFAKVASIDATGSSGGVAVTGALNIGATIVGGANDAVTAGLLNGNTALKSFKGGSGNDFIDLTSLSIAQVNALTTLDGGTGGRDTVIYQAAVLNTGTALAATGFEIVGSGPGLTGTVNWANLGVGVDTVQLFGTAAGDTTFNNVPSLPGGATLAFGVFSGTSLNYTFNGPSGTNNIFNLTETMHGKDFGKLTFNSFETVNLTITDTTNGVADINNIKMVPSVGGGAVLNLVENQVGVIGTGTTVDVHGTTDVTANGAIKISGSDQGAVLLEGVVTASLLDASGFAGPLVTGSTSVNTDKGGATSAITILGSPQNDSLIGSTAKDTINSGAGNDIVADQLNAISKTTDNDQISLGTGKDLVNLFGDTAGAGGTALTTAVGQIPLVADFAVSTPDALGLSQNILNYNGIEANIFPGIVAAAPGNTVVQDIVPGATVGVGANTDLLHLGSFNEAAGMTIGQAFAAALGGGTVTGFAPGAGNTIFFSMFDLTTGQMLIGDVNSEFAALHSQLTSADAGSVHLIAAMMMSAADYIAFSTNNLRIVT